MTATPELPLTVVCFTSYLACLLPVQLVNSESYIVYVCMACCTSLGLVSRDYALTPLCQDVVLVFSYTVLYYPTF